MPTEYFDILDRPIKLGDWVVASCGGTVRHSLKSGFVERIDRKDGRITIRGKNGSTYAPYPRNIYIIDREY